MICQLSVGPVKKLKTPACKTSLGNSPTSTGSENDETVCACVVEDSEDGTATVDCLMCLEDLLNETMLF